MVILLEELSFGPRPAPLDVCRRLKAEIMGLRDVKVGGAELGIYRRSVGIYRHIPRYFLADELLDGHGPHSGDDPHGESPQRGACDARDADFRFEAIFFEAMVEIGTLFVRPEVCLIDLYRLLRLEFGAFDYMDSEEPVESPYGHLREAGEIRRLLDPISLHPRPEKYHERGERYAEVSEPCSRKQRELLPASGAMVPILSGDFFDLE